MKTYGLIGKKLGHSFSKRFFTEKFQKENIPDCRYELFELPDIHQLPALLEEKKGELQGLNVTIPYKQAVIPSLDHLDESAEKTGAVNVIKVEANGSLSGYNSDYYGFRTSLERFIAGATHPLQALVLGTGGAAKAVIAALKDLRIPYQLISRKTQAETLTYAEISQNPSLVQAYKLWINTTPLGMFPDVESCPDLPYEQCDDSHYLFDLVYNPEETLFMQKGKAQAAHTKNGLEMLILQAERSWEIWNNQDECKAT